MSITHKQFFAYTLMPQLRPRFVALFGVGFFYVPFFIALLYGAVGLLPAGHPYLNPANKGRFTLRAVVAVAANNLIFSLRHIDQFIVFAMILAGLILLLLQIFLLPLVFAFTAMPVLAQSLSMFITPDPTQDLANMLMDMVFGIPNIFNSCVSTAAACVDLDGSVVLSTLGGFPHPIHYGLHYVFSVFSTGLIVVAVFLVSYFVAAVVVETSQTGTAFGKRFSHAWVPLRLLMAVGLLWPGGYGLNSAQYIVLYAAKYGSGFATNGWHLFLDTLAGANLDQNLSLIGTPNIPEIGAILQFYHVAATCKEAYKIGENIDIKPYLVRGPFSTPTQLEIMADKPTYQEMIVFAEGGDKVVVRFGGPPDKENNPLWKGFIRPLCGEIVFTLADPRNPENAENKPDPGPLIMQTKYWDMLRGLWFDQFTAPNYPQNIVKKHMKSAYDKATPNPPQIPNERKTAILTAYETYVREALAQSIEAQLKLDKWGVSPEFKAKGWGFAGALYDYVAQKGIPISTAAYGIFMPSKYPELMEQVCADRKAKDKTASGIGCFDPTTGDGTTVALTGPQREMIGSMVEAAKQWGGTGNTASAYTESTGNPLMDFIHLIFGTEGLFNMRNNTNVHPLAQLTMVGRTLVESAVRNIGYSLAAGAGSAFAPGFLGGILSSTSGLLVTVAIAALSIGFLLAYVIPFLPFVYFFFGLGIWVKTILDAMVGVPLWALAHIRIDKDGLAGDAAKEGYYLIFEIFLRPILLVFGLLAGIITFSALVLTLNETFDLIIVNLAGFSGREQLSDPNFTDAAYYRGPIDAFFFTVVYCVLVYMIGMASFKLIDLIPNQILRWMGSSATTFGSSEENPAEQMQSISMNTQQYFGGAQSGISGLSGLLSKLKG